MSAEEARELPAGTVGKLVDYAIDDDAVTEFNRSKEQANIKRQRRLRPWCCRRHREAVAPDAPGKTARPQFAAEVDALAESATALHYRIERAEEEKAQWKKHFTTARNAFSGRFYKVRDPGSIRCYRCCVVVAPFAC